MTADRHAPIGTTEAVVARARALIPVLRERAGGTDRARARRCAICRAKELEAQLLLHQRSKTRPNVRAEGTGIKGSPCLQLQPKR